MRRDVPPRSFTEEAPVPVGKFEIKIDTRNAMLTAPPEARLTASTSVPGMASNIPPRTIVLPIRAYARSPSVPVSVPFAFERRSSNIVPM